MTKEKKGKTTMQGTTKGRPTRKIAYLLAVCPDGLATDLGHSKGLFKGLGQVNC